MGDNYSVKSDGCCKMSGGCVNFARCYIFAFNTFFLLTSMAVCGLLLYLIYYHKEIAGGFLTVTVIQTLYHNAIVPVVFCGTLSMFALLTIFVLAKDNLQLTLFLSILSTILIVLVFSYGAIIYLNDQIFFKRLEETLQMIESENEQFNDFIETKFNCCGDFENSYTFGEMHQIEEKLTVMQIACNFRILKCTNIVNDFFKSPVYIFLVTALITVMGKFVELASSFLLSSQPKDYTLF
ncbi:uncharacterized protein LOC116343993 [Contarinia nasturtii]|uniref:uncharacterized protein LOC116343993 n=1 Tax=Contarinia nasturtii TaxID=265458 RepID=UPI0012D4A0AA|nr:uncharacterized protein LOC116343993 [Contarinia nasturtii]